MLSFILQNYVMKLETCISFFAWNNVIKKTNIACSGTMIMCRLFMLSACDDATPIQMNLNPMSVNCK